MKKALIDNMGNPVLVGNVYKTNVFTTGYRYEEFLTIVDIDECSRSKIGVAGAWIRFLKDGNLDTDVIYNRELISISK